MQPEDGTAPDEQSGGVDDGRTDADDERLPSGSAPEWGPDASRTWATGDRKPTPPTAAETVRLAAAVEVRTVAEELTALRVRLADGSAATRGNVLSELHTEPGVVGTTAGESFGPDAEDAFDALLAPEHDSLLASSAMSTLDPVDGVAFASYPTGSLPDLDDATTRGPTPSESPADTEEDGTPRTEEASQEDVAAAVGSTGDGPESDPADEPDGSTPEGVEEADFEQLRAEVSTASYDDVVEELDDVEVGTDEPEVDIDPLVEETKTFGETAPDHTVPGGGVTAPGDDVAMFEDTGSDAGWDTGETDEERELDPDDVLDAVVTALDDRTLRESELTAFREALGITSPESLRARVDHLGGRVNELFAYRDELAEFVDETDGGERIDALESTAESLTDAVEELRETTAVLQRRTAAHEDRLATLTDAVQDGADAGTAELGLDEEFDRLDRQLDEVDRELAALSDDVAALRDWKEDLHAAFGPDADGGGFAPPENDVDAPEQTDD